MERLARTVIRHRRLVGVLWLALFLVGGSSASQLSDRLALEFSLPGQPGDTAEKQLLESYGVTSQDTLIVSVTVPEGQRVEDDEDAVAGVFDAVRRAAPQVQVTDFRSAADPALITADGRTAYGLVQGPPPRGFADNVSLQVEPALAGAAAAAGFESGVTSYQLLSAGGDTEGPSVLVETLIGAIGALVVLLFVFASFLALLPLLIAAVSILTTFLLVLGLTTVTDVSFVVQFLISLIGLGVAIDYSLLLVSRWREERARGRSNEDAVVVAMTTAGHAVLASGFTVAISLLALLVVPVPFLRSMGIAGMLIPLVSVAVVLTLLPALLSGIGPRIDWPRIRKEGTASQGWSTWARTVVKRRFVATGAAAVALGFLIAPVFGLQIGSSEIGSLARTGPPVEALRTLTDKGVGEGILTPLVVLVAPDDAEAAAAAAGEVDGIQLAVVSASERDVAVVNVLPEQETVNSAGREVLDDVRFAVEEAVDGEVGITGIGATVEDYFSAVYDNFPYVLVVISVITFILLMRTFRSILLPIKAVILNLVSLAAVFGAVVWFWQQGNGSQAVFDVAPTGAISFWLPVLIFAFLFGLSMDYEVFILARMREEYDSTGDTGTAVVTGLGRTGRLVTSAALILFFAFAALASAPGTDIKVLGTALGVGILIDATIVRALLVPALVSLFGRWNWWLPTPLARILRVEPSPLERRGRETGVGPATVSASGSAAVSASGSAA
ncbi:MAG: MMPL family transporter, partial [Dermatophilaceae bacterium]